MKATQLGKRLKKLTGTESYDTALAAVEQALAEQQPRQPIGVTLVVDARGSGLYWPTLLAPFRSVNEIKMLQMACRHFANEELANMLEQALVAQRNKAKDEESTS